MIQTQCKCKTTIRRGQEVLEQCPPCKTEHDEIHARWTEDYRRSQVSDAGEQ